MLLYMDAFYNFVGPLLGLGTEPKDLTFAQISLRGVVVFLATLVMMRFSSKRSLAEKNCVRRGPDRNSGVRAFPRD